MSTKEASPEREQTDESLRKEREKTDHALAERRQAAEEDYDMVVSRARESADAVLTEARAKADERLEASPDAGTSATLAEERVLEDEALIAALLACTVNAESKTSQLPQPQTTKSLWKSNRS